MARKYSKKASAKVGRAMKKRKAGTLKSGRSGKKVKSRKQAIAIGLSEARAEGKKVPKKAAKKKTTKKRKTQRRRLRRSGRPQEVTRLIAVIASEAKQSISNSPRSWIASSQLSSQ